jgi:hypothetical protein
MLKKMSIIVVVAGLVFALAPAAQAAIIDGANNNGGFISATTGETGIDGDSGMTDWTIDNRIWIDDNNTTLGTAPFGADTATNSRFIQIHDNAGSTLTSNAFALTAGHTLEFSIDVKVGGNAVGSITMDLWDGTNSIALGSIDTNTWATAWTQYDDNTASVATSGTYQFRLVTSADAGDAHVDRVYLESTVPEPATMSLLVMGGLGVLARRRRRRA